MSSKKRARVNNEKNAIWAELRRGWLIILAVTLGNAVGPVSLMSYTGGVFMGPLQQEFGLSRGTASLTFSIYGAMVALSAPFAGTLVDRHGVRWLLLGSLLSSIAAFAAIYVLPSIFPVFLACIVSVGLLGAGASTAILSRIVVSNFDKSRGAALGIGLLGTGITSTFAPHFFGTIVSDHDWRTGYLAFAGVILVCLPFMVVPIWRQPDRSATSAAALDTSQQDAGAILRSVIFWKLGCAFCILQLCALGGMYHFVPLLQDRGLSTSDATIMAGLVGVVMLIARLTVGVAVDHIFAPRVAFIVSMLAALGIGVLATGASWSAAIGAIAFGLLIGAEFDLAAYLVSRYFPPAQFGRAYGMLYTILVSGALTSTSLYGFSVDLTGSYTLTLAIASVGITAAALIFLWLPAFPQVSEPALAESASVRTDDDSAAARSAGAQPI
jgi:MFS family permease